MKKEVSNFIFNQNKVVFCGAQGTGKTTLLDELFRDRNIAATHEKITEIFRNFQKTHHLPINTESGLTTQVLGFNKYLEYFLTHKKFISDRGLIDVYAYTKYFASLKKDPNIGEDLLNFQRFIIKTYKSLVTHTFYFPIEFSVVADGVRSLDEGYRRSIDKIILDAFKEFEIDYCVITGTTEERVQKFYNYLIPNK